jgi:multisubunit Na+/H+ antiporter MnhC subunit
MYFYIDIAVYCGIGTYSVGRGSMMDIILGLILVIRGQNMG